MAEPIEQIIFKCIWDCKEATRNAKEISKKAEDVKERFKIATLSIAKGAKLVSRDISSILRPSASVIKGFDHLKEIGVKSAEDIQGSWNRLYSLIAPLTTRQKELIEIQDKLKKASVDVPQAIVKEEKKVSSILTDVLSLTQKGQKAFEKIKVLPPTEIATLKAGHQYLEKLTEPAKATVEVKAKLPEIPTPKVPIPKVPPAETEPIEQIIKCVLQCEDATKQIKELTKPVELFVKCVPVIEDLAKTIQDAMKSVTIPVQISMPEIKKPEVPTVEMPSYKVVEMPVQISTLGQEEVFKILSALKTKEAELITTFKQVEIPEDIKSELYDISSAIGTINIAMKTAERFKIAVPDYTKALEPASNYFKQIGIDIKDIVRAPSISVDTKSFSDLNDLVQMLTDRREKIISTFKGIEIPKKSLEELTFIKKSITGINRISRASRPIRLVDYKDLKYYDDAREYLIGLRKNVEAIDVTTAAEQLKTLAKPRETILKVKQEIPDISKQIETIKETVKIPTEVTKPIVPKLPIAEPIKQIITCIIECDEATKQIQELIKDRQLIIRCVPDITDVTAILQQIQQETIAPQIVPKPVEPIELEPVKQYIETVRQKVPELELPPLIQNILASTEPIQVPELKPLEQFVMLQYRRIPEVELPPAVQELFVKLPERPTVKFTPFLEEMPELPTLEPVKQVIECVLPCIETTKAALDKLVAVPRTITIKCELIPPEVVEKLQAMIPALKTVIAEFEKLKKPIETMRMVAAAGAEITGKLKEQRKQVDKLRGVRASYYEEIEGFTGRESMMMRYLARDIMRIGWTYAMIGGVATGALWAIVKASEGLTDAMGGLKDALSDIVSTIFEGLEPALDTIAELMDRVAIAFEAFPAPLKTGIAIVIVAALAFVAIWGLLASTILRFLGTVMLLRHGLYDMTIRFYETIKAAKGAEFQFLKLSMATSAPMLKLMGLGSLLKKIGIGLSKEEAVIKSLGEQLGILTKKGDVYLTKGIDLKKVTKAEATSFVLLNDYAKALGRTIPMLSEQASKLVKYMDPKVYTQLATELDITNELISLYQTRTERVVGALKKVGKFTLKTTGAVIGGIGAYILFSGVMQGLTEYMDELSDVTSELGALIGETLLPVIRLIANAIQGFLDLIEMLPPWASIVVKGIVGWGIATIGLVFILGQLAKSLSLTTGLFKWFGEKLGIVKKQMKDIKIATEEAVEPTKKVSKAVNDTAKNMKTMTDGGMKLTSSVKNSTKSVKDSTNIISTAGDNMQTYNKQVKNVSEQTTTQIGIMTRLNSALKTIGPTLIKLTALGVGLYITFRLLEPVLEALADILEPIAYGFATLMEVSPIVGIIALIAGITALIIVYKLFASLIEGLIGKFIGLIGAKLGLAKTSGGVAIAIGTASTAQVMMTGTTITLTAAIWKLVTALIALKIALLTLCFKHVIPVAEVFTNVLTSIVNVGNILVGNIQKLGKGLKQLCFRHITPQAIQFNSVMEKIADRTLKRFLSGFRSMARKVRWSADIIGQAFADIIEGIGEGAGTIITAIGRMLSDILGSIGTALSDVVDAFSNMMIDIFGSIQTNAPLVINAFGDMVVSIANSIRTNVSKVIDAFAMIIIGIFEDIGRYLPMIITAFSDMIVNIANSIGENAEKVIEAIANMFIRIFTKVGEEIPKVVTSFAKMIINIADSIGKNAIEVIDAIGDIFIEIFKKLGAKIPEVIDTFGDMVVSIAGAITDNVYKISDAISGEGGVIPAISDAITSGIEAITDLGVDIINAIKEGIISGIDTVKDAIGEVLEHIVSGCPGGGLEDLPKLGATWAVQLPIAIAKSVEGGISAIKDAIGGVGTTVISGILGFVNWVADIFCVPHIIEDALLAGVNPIAKATDIMGEAIINSVSNTVKTMRDIMSENMELNMGIRTSIESISRIPSLEEGGAIRRPGLYFLHPEEIVLPGPFGTRPTIIYTTNYINIYPREVSPTMTDLEKRELAREISGYIESDIRRKIG